MKVRYIYKRNFKAKGMKKKQDVLRSLASSSIYLYKVYQLL